MWNICGEQSVPSSLASDRVYNTSNLFEYGHLMKAAFHPVHQVKPGGGLFSVALSVALRPPVFHWHPLLRRPDFPPLLPINRQKRR
ncbi:Uncharacterized protein SCG7109_AK_00250 [Chlamydiales bacterium SCGC AG-110-M15]|nr:Uncharacterized protein SCG7109_AK_00250 [Chlamydiales bacterium SCGC AG-110-M15]